MRLIEVKICQNESYEWLQEKKTKSESVTILTRLSFCISWYTKITPLNWVKKTRTMWIWGEEGVSKLHCMQSNATRFMWTIFLWLDMSSLLTVLFIHSSNMSWKYEMHHWDSLFQLCSLSAGRIKQHSVATFVHFTVFTSESNERRSEKKNARNKTMHTIKTKFTRNCSFDVRSENWYVAAVGELNGNNWEIFFFHAAR